MSILRALKRLALAATQRTPSTMESVSSVEEQLYACLFPGRGRYSPQHAAVLAGRLREVADSLGQARQQQVKPDEEPDGKRRRKELRGRGASAGGRRRCRFLHLMRGVVQI